MSHKHHLVANSSHQKWIVFQRLVILTVELVDISAGKGACAWVPRPGEAFWGLLGYRVVTKTGTVGNRFEDYQMAGFEFLKHKLATGIVLLDYQSGMDSGSHAWGLSKLFLPCFSTSIAAELRNKYTNACKAVRGIPSQWEVGTNVSNHRHQLC